MAGMNFFERNVRLYEKLVADGYYVRPCYTESDDNAKERHIEYMIVSAGAVRLEGRKYLPEIEAASGPHPDGAEPGYEDKGFPPITPWPCT